MLLLISDANILVDMNIGRLINKMFSLSYQFAVPDVLFAEELEERHSNFLNLGLSQLPLSEDLVEKAYKQKAAYKRVSFAIRTKWQLRLVLQ